MKNKKVTVTISPAKVGGSMPTKKTKPKGRKLIPVTKEARDAASRATRFPVMYGTPGIGKSRMVLTDLTKVGNWMAQTLTEPQKYALRLRGSSNKYLLRFTYPKFGYMKPVYTTKLRDARKFGKDDATLISSLFFVHLYGNTLFVVQPVTFATCKTWAEGHDDVRT